LSKSPPKALSSLYRNFHFFYAGYGEVLV
jgi:hypothetical protein